MVNKKQQILRINKFIIFFLIFSLCGGGSETSETVEEAQDTTTTTQAQDTTTTTQAQDTTTTTQAQDTSASGSWANVKGPPMIYAASDVSQSTIDKTLKWYQIASSAWGEFGPAEIWIVGNSKDTVLDLEDLWCDIRTEKDTKWNKEWDCANEYWSPFARYVDDGGAAVSTYYRDYIDYHFFLVTMGPKYPSPDEDDYKVVTMHEYFHIYQHAHISNIDDEGPSSAKRDEKMGGADKPWFAEGGAEYMAQLLYSRQPNVRSNYLKEIMDRKAYSIGEYLDYGKPLKDLTYSDPVQTYDIGTWLVAYIVDKVGEETFRVNFYRDLDGLGFEESFKKHFGMGSDQLIIEFDEWIKQPVDELLKIIP